MEQFLIMVLGPDGQDICIGDHMSVTGPNLIEVDESENFLMNYGTGESFESTTTNNTSECYFDPVDIAEDLWLIQ
jgi:hypothetical protein